MTATDILPLVLESPQDHNIPPDAELKSTLGPLVLAEHPNLVVYLYPGASGIIRGDETPLIDAAQHRGFRTYLADFTACGFTVVGLSSQTIQRQRQVSHRNRLSHALVSDPNFWFAEALGLPTLRLDAARVYERVTLVVTDGSTSLALHPRPTPESHPALLAELLRSNLQR